MAIVLPRYHSFRQLEVAEELIMTELQPALHNCRNSMPENQPKLFERTNIFRGVILRLDDERCV